MVGAVHTIKNREYLDTQVEVPADEVKDSKYELQGCQSRCLPSNR